jgi:hypothetical protein
VRDHRWAYVSIDERSASAAKGAYSETVASTSGTVVERSVD